MIIRNKAASYTCIPNHLIVDGRLPWEARMILIYLLSKPDNWNVQISHLVKAGSAKRNKVYEVLKTLRRFGYLECQRKPTGHTEWLIYDTPQPQSEPHPEIRDEAVKPHPKIRDEGESNKNTREKPSPKPHPKIRDEGQTRTREPHPKIRDDLVITDSLTNTESRLSHAHAHARSKTQTKNSNIEFNTTSLPKNRTPPPPPKDFQPDDDTLAHLDKLLKSGWITSADWVRAVIQSCLDYYREEGKYKWDYQAAVRRWLTRQAWIEKENSAQAGSYGPRNKTSCNDRGSYYGQNRRFNQRKLSVSERALEQERWYAAKCAREIDGNTAGSNEQNDHAPVDEDEPDLWSLLDVGHGTGA